MNEDRMNTEQSVVREVSEMVEVAQRPACMPRVVVTAVGALTSQGADSQALWAGASAGRVAIGPVRGLPMNGYRTDLGGEVTDTRHPDYDYLAGIGGHRSERALDFALLAAQEAMAGAGLSVSAAGRRPVPAHCPHTGGE